ncbi:MAG: hypothetical protein Q9159_000016 [Coniocarpon cinnabarinum]
MSSLRLSRPATLRNTAQSFCHAFITQLPSSQILEDYFVPETANQKPKITEHGPSWARERLPFLGQTFTGQSQCQQYFTLLSQTLSIELKSNAFKEEELVVDPDAIAFPSPPSDTSKTSHTSNPSTTSGPLNTSTSNEDDSNVQDNERRGIVTIVGRGRFTSLKTKRGWDEIFTYRLSEFDEMGRIGHWEIWADPLSAWVAVGDEDSGRELQS